MIMANNVQKLGLVSFRNPWAPLIKKGVKRIENRKKDIPNQNLNVWMALHVSKTLKADDKKNCAEYMSPQFKVDKDCGKIIALFKISDNVDSEKAKQIDPVHADKPHETQHHWVIDDVIPFKPGQHIEYKGMYSVFNFVHFCQECSLER